MVRAWSPLGRFEPGGSSPPTAAASRWCFAVTARWCAQRRVQPRRQVGAHRLVRRHGAALAPRREPRRRAPRARRRAGVSPPSTGAAIE
jgi:hypothetical protein